MADKKSFVLYCDYRKHFSLLSPVDRGHLIMAIFDYVETGEEPELYGMAVMAFSFIRAQLDRDIEKYRETCRRRAEAGRAGGLAKAANAKQGQANGSNAKQGQANLADNDNDNDNENVNDNENDNGNVNGNVPFRPRQAGTNQFLNILMDDGT